MPQNITIPNGGVTSGVITLAPNDVVTVSFAENIARAAVWTDGAHDLWVTGDGTTPVVGQSYRVQAGLVGRFFVLTNNAAAGPLDQVKVVSAGTPTVTVEKA